MDLGFYDAYKFSGGENWKATASYPPMLYPTHSIGGILGAWNTHATSVSAIGVVDDRGDGVFDREVCLFDNDFSNMTGLFEVAGGGSFRVNEFRRVGFPSHIRESRFRWFGTEATLRADDHHRVPAGQVRRHRRVRGDRATQGHRGGAGRADRTSPRPCGTRSCRAGARARSEPAARPSSPVPPTGTRAPTTSWPTTSSPRSTAARCRR